MSKVIVSDQDVKFTLKFWTLLMKKTWTKLKCSIVVQLQINGQIERMNRILNQYLHYYITIDHKDWGNHLGLVEFR